MEITDLCPGRGNSVKPEVQTTVHSSAVLDLHGSPVQENKGINSSSLSAFDTGSFLGQNNTFPEKERGC